MIKRKTGTPAILAGLLLMAVLLAGCPNTIRGVGQDVKDSGKAVEQAVE